MIVVKNNVINCTSSFSLRGLYSINFLNLVFAETKLKLSLKVFVFTKQNKPELSNYDI